MPPLAQPSLRFWVRHACCVRTPKPPPSPVQSFTGLSLRLAQPILISGLMFAYTIMKPYSDHLGRAKLFFALTTPSPAGSTALSLVTQSEDNGQFVVTYKFYSYNN